MTLVPKLGNNDHMQYSPRGRLSLGRRARQAHRAGEAPGPGTAVGAWDQGCNKGRVDDENAKTRYRDFGALAGNQSINHRWIKCQPTSSTPPMSSKSFWRDRPSTPLFVSGRLDVRQSRPEPRFRKEGHGIGNARACQDLARNSFPFGRDQTLDSQDTMEQDPVMSSFLTDMETGRQPKVTSGEYSTER